MRTLRTGLAATFVAFIACMGLIISTPQPAAAFDAGKLAKAGAKGATVGGPASLFGKWSNPVGWTITAGTIVYGAWSAKDEWMEIQRPTFSFWEHVRQLDDSLPIDPPPSVDVNYFSDSISSVRILAVAQRTVTIEWTQNEAYRPFQIGGGNNVAQLYHVDPAQHDRVDCRNLSTGVLRSVDLSVGSQGTKLSILAGPPAARTASKTSDALCNADEEIAGFLTVPRKTTGSYTAQGFAVGWGTLATTADFGLYDKPVTFGEYEVTVRCKNNTTGATDTITSRTDTAEGGAMIPSCAGRLGPEWHNAGVTIAPTKPKIDGEPIPDEIEVPDFLPLDWDELIPDDPDWDPCIGSKEGCKLDVFIDGSRCQIGSDLCKTWTRLDTKAPSRVKCQYGSRTIDKKFCAPLAAYYDVTTDTRVDLDKGTTSPETQTETPVKTENANPNFNDPATQAESGECFPSGWGLLNPVEWVLKPVKCALEWAFVPETGIATRFNRMKDSLVTRAPFSWVASLAALPTGVSGGGCPVNWAFTFKGHQYSLICGTPVEPVVRAARPVFLVLALGAAAYPFIRSLVYASVPIVKPTPT